jgi:glycosyltransferase involved in cell wall biosynthesis
MKTVVVVPVYNERHTVISVLNSLRALGDLLGEIVVVNDGSTDGSGEIIAEWAKGQEQVTVLSHPVNRGYSEALLTGFRHVLDKVESGQLSPSDAVVTIDADGQHDPSELPGFLKTLEEQGLDVVWARRDFSLYPWLKRFGNRIMSVIGSLFAGYPFKDVECGYCVFRIGALGDALRYQKRDSRYSLSLTLAVALARLGYKISNDSVASVKLFRSRTRIVDVLWDTLAAANTWAKVTLARIRSRPEVLLRLALGALVLAGTLAVLVLIALKRIYLGHDSINNYAHVWYISKHIYSGSLPMHVQNLDNGAALTYPYAFVPWTLAALFYPVLGDYAVTLTMVLGAVLILFVVYRAFLNSRAWLLMFFIIMPFFLQGLLNFQMPFIWALLFGYLYVWAIEKRSFLWAFLWLVLSAGNHLVIMGPILAAYTIYVYWREPSLRKSLIWICVPALVPLGALAWYTLSIPTVAENSPVTIFRIYLMTIAPRATLFASPFAFRKFASLQWVGARYFMGWMGACLLLAGTVGANFAYPGYSGLLAQANNDYQEYLKSDAFVTGAVYRIVESPGHELGDYYAIKQGAILSNEFFDESYFRRDWTEASYRCYLSAKSVDFVVLSTDYLQRYHKNEGDIIESLRNQGLVRLIYEDPQGRFMVYDVKAVRSDLGKHSVRECIGLDNGVM